MECDICKRTVGSTNYHGITLPSGETVHVCGKHYAQYRKYGKFLDASPKGCQDANDFKVEGDVATIYTRRSNGEISGFFIIDKDDLDEVIKRKWRLWKNRFFTGVKRPISIADFLLPHKPKGKVIDHINQNPADNRRCNLRITTQGKNVCNKTIIGTNTSGITGVWFDKARNKWSAEIKLNYIKIHLGRYDLFEDACYARYLAELILFGVFRSTTNDSILLPVVEKCRDKDRIDTYVSQRILDKYYPLSRLAI